ncbi:MAG TPA: hypothetical protein VJZ72_08620, partial [Candidatus Limnocylindrales bacterium]|nr:hypothetical protein [Candidatus Limnocylindrales bacterium]
GWTVAGSLATAAARRGSGPGRSSSARAEQPPTPVMPTPRRARSTGRRQRLSKDTYRRRSGEVESELTRLGLRKNHLELALGDPTVQRNFVEMRRVTSELADVEAALAVAEDAWLELQEMAP